MTWEHELLDAVADDDINLVRELLDNCSETQKNIGQHSWSTGRNPLHFACRKGRNEILKLLLERGADVNAVSVDNKGNTMTLLHWAIYYNQTQTSVLLLDRGADCSAWGKCLSYVGTPLEVARQIGRPQIEEIVSNSCCRMGRKPSQQNTNVPDKAQQTVDVLEESLRVAMKLQKEMRKKDEEKAKVQKRLAMLEEEEKVIREKIGYKEDNEINDLCKRIGNLKGCLRLNSVDEECEFCQKKLETEKMRTSCIQCEIPLCWDCGRIVGVCSNCTFDYNLT